MIKYKVKLYLMCTILILLMTATFSWFVRNTYYVGGSFEYEKTVSTPLSLSFVNYVGVQDEFGHVEYTKIYDADSTDELVYDSSVFNALYPGSSVIFKTEVINPFDRDIDFSINLGNISISSTLVDYLTIICTNPTSNVIKASDYSVESSTDDLVIDNVYLVSNAVVPAAESEESGVYEIYWFVNISTAAGNEIMNDSFGIEYIQVQG